MNQSTSRALAVALNAEYAAVFTYGIVAAYAADSRRTDIAAATAAHRALRDALIRRLTDAGQAVPEAAAGYTLPVAVTDSITGYRAALAAEEQCCVAYRSLIEQAAESDDRRIGIDGLRDCAIRAANWRLVLRISPATTALPGTPGE
ncbi:hypothetical protein GCM10027169_36800 [Gordonia jinhuaensis]|uniref:DUF4439 domain-containing protein n=1 Tax=Gordonia jinhuaensis TaxID=1517702 RepID=A0A916T0Y2_9ACTN|nr:ferritin-like domain-containing protein [Gordonia jinhuaensis]GGB26786.1 hypothetical protein GCM10011489_13630 [Gordonia jinhuaensis]